MIRNETGFTLVELLIVIAIIAILAAVVFVALDPATRFADSRDSTRWGEVNSVLNAILKFQVDNDGTLPTGIDDVAGTVQILGVDDTDDDLVGNDTDCTVVVTCAGSDDAVYSAAASGCYVDLSGDLVDGYLASIPEDPQNGTDDDTRYYINKTAQGRITIGSCDEENSTEIEVQR
ncbi:MAG: prepilin-type N-terminal cleavage/methylation domain-containing protein [Patescibacteria group bacterium]